MRKPTGHENRNLFFSKRYNVTTNSEYVEDISPLSVPEEQEQNTPTNCSQFSAALWANIALSVPLRPPIEQSQLYTLRIKKLHLSYEIKKDEIIISAILKQNDETADTIVNRNLINQLARSIQQHRMNPTISITSLDNDRRLASLTIQKQRNYGQPTQEATITRILQSQFNAYLRLLGTLESAPTDSRPQLAVG